MPDHFHHGTHAGTPPQKERTRRRHTVQQWRRTKHDDLSANQGKHSPVSLEQEVRHLMQSDGVGGLTRKVVDNLHHTHPELLHDLIGELLPHTRPNLTPDPISRRWLWNRLRHHASNPRTFPWVCAAAETETHPAVLETLGEWVTCRPCHERLTLDAILSRRLAPGATPIEEFSRETEIRLWELRLQLNYGTHHPPLVHDLTRRIKTAPIPLSGRLIDFAEHFRLITDRYLTDHILDAILERGDPEQTGAGELFGKLAAPPRPPGALEYHLIDRCRRGELRPSTTTLRWIAWLLHPRRLNPETSHPLPPLPRDQWQELCRNADVCFFP